MPATIDVDITTASPVVSANVGVPFTVEVPVTVGVDVVLGELAADVAEPTSVKVPPPGAVPGVPPPAPPVTAELAAPNALGPKI